MASRAPPKRDKGDRGHGRCAVGTYLHTQTGTAFTQSIFFGLLFVLAALPCCFIWLAFGTSLQRYLHTERAARVFNIAMGVLLAGAVVLFIL
jgi:threonine/homoserine/homoserine lactone efflux protein